MSFSSPIFNENFPQYSLEKLKIRLQNVVLLSSSDNVRRVNVNVNGALEIKDKH